MASDQSSSVARAWRISAIASSSDVASSKTREAVCCTESRRASSARGRLLIGAHSNDENRVCFPIPTISAQAPSDGLGRLPAKNQRRAATGPPAPRFRCLLDRVLGGLHRTGAHDLAGRLGLEDRRL